MDVVTEAAELDRTRSENDPDVCHLEVGQPAGTAPESVLSAAREALGSPIVYTDSLGRADLCRKIAHSYGLRHDLDLNPERIAVTTGASAGCVMAFLAVFDPGDRLGVVEPGYPCYANVARALGIEVVRVSVDEEHGYQPTRKTLDAAGPLDGLIVASPSNPTGTVLSATELETIHEWCRGNNCFLLVDEIYHGTSDTTEPTAAGLDDTIVIQSFSKYFCMTGWRIGWLVLPEQFRRPIQMLAQNLYLCPPSLSQSAALGAFDARPELDRRASVYRTNREILTTALVNAGAHRIAPASGAFYIWADLGHVGNSNDTAKALLCDVRVACTPGGDFDSRTGDRHIRFSVAGSTEEITEAASRISSWLP